jgi:hypothetical protein
MYKIEVDSELRLIRIRHYDKYVGAELVSAMTDLLLNWASYSADRPLADYGKMFVDLSETTGLTLEDTDSAFHYTSGKRLEGLGFAKNFRMVLLKPRTQVGEAERRFKKVKEMGAWRELDISMVDSLEEVVLWLELPASYKPSE